MTDSAALDALQQTCRLEGIIPALESSHAVAALPEIVQRLSRSDIDNPVVIVCLSGRGDKDIDTVSRALGVGL